MLIKTARAILTFLNRPEPPDANQLGSYTNNEKVGEGQCVKHDNSILERGDNCHSRIQRVAEKEVTLGRQ